eukprot:scaffold22249_cov80-Phaeocystis_antarctica.AAC.1
MVPATPHSTPSFGSSSFSVSFHDASQDQYNQRIRRVEIATGATTTLAGSGSAGFGDGAGGSARFKYPGGVAIDPTGGFALVAVRASPASPASRHPAYRLLAHAVGRTHSHRHATSRTAAWRSSPPPSVHHRTRTTTAFAAWSEAEPKASSKFAGSRGRICGPLP